MKSIKWLLSIFVFTQFSTTVIKSQDISSRILSDLKSNYKISLILPLNSKNTESTDHNNFIDFYQGVLLAAEDAKLDGINTDISVFDSDEYENIKLLALSGKLDNSDLILGPVLLKDIERILPFANERGIPLASPLDSRAEFLTIENPWIYQLTTPIEMQQSNLLSSLTGNEHITIIHEAGNADKELFETSVNYLNTNSLNYNTFSYSVVKDKSYYNQIVSLLNHDELNHIIIPSASEAFVYDILRNLNLMSTMAGYKIKIYGTSRWRNFELVDLSYFHSMNLTISMSYFVDYSNPKVKEFLFRYRALYQNEPSAYAFQGYDLTYFFLTYWSVYGKNYDKITEVTGKMLQSDISFIKRGEGFINSATRKVEYLPGFLVQSSSFNR